MTPAATSTTASAISASPWTGQNELVRSSATALAQAIRAKQVSALEVVEAHLQQLAAVNPRLNAVVQLPADAARAQARAADAALARGEIRGPLHGGWRT